MDRVGYFVGELVWEVTQGLTRGWEPGDVFPHKTKTLLQWNGERWVAIMCFNQQGTYSDGSVAWGDAKAVGTTYTVGKEEL